MRSKSWPVKINRSQSVQIVSTGDRVEVLAKKSIVLQSGTCSITLAGSDIIFRCPGQFLVKFRHHTVRLSEWRKISLLDLGRHQKSLDGR
jgi:uncharacterized protein (DUF2345 family)